MKAAVKRTGILVSTGGGAVGDSVFEAAIGAAKALTLPWTMVVGGSDERIQSYAQAAPENMHVTGLIPTFRTMLAEAEASVSLVGYNTAMDLLQRGTPGVLVPFDAGNEVEQSIRGEALRALPGFEVLPEGQLTAETLTEALRSVLKSGPRPPRYDNMDGASQTVLLCEQLLKNAR
jgi:predicted glycosyltransferase